MADVFISCSRKDQHFVRRLHEALAGQGRDTWVDWEGIPPTAEWMKEIHAAIEAADTFVFVISPDSAASEVCKLEVEHAARQHKRLVPVVYRDVPANRVTEVLTKLNWIFFREQDDFNQSLQTLLKALDTNLDWVHGHTRLLVRAGEWDREKRDSSELLPGRIAELKTGTGSIKAAGFDPSGRYAAVVHDGEHVSVWDLVAARRITSWESSTEVGESTQAVAVAVGGEYLVVSRYNRSPNVKTSTLTVRRLPEAARIASLQEKGQINGSLRLDPKGRYVFIVAGLNTWGANLRNGERLPAPTVDARIYDMAFNANGAYLASVFRKKGRREFAVQIVDPATGEEVNRWALPERGTSVLWSPDSTELAVGFKNTLSRYDATTGLALDTYARPENPSAESASGHLVATRVKDTSLLRISNLTGGKDIVNVPLGGELKVAAFQPAAGTLATLTVGGENTLAVWTLRNRRTVADIALESPRMELEFSDDSRVLFIGNDKRADCWRLPDSPPVDGRLEKFDGACTKARSRPHRVLTDNPFGGSPSDDRVEVVDGAGKIV